MDPQAALKKWLNGASEMDEAGYDLDKWFAGGGFRPALTLHLTEPLSTRPAEPIGPES